MKVIPKMIGTKTPTSNKAAMMVIGKYPRLIYKLLIFLGMINHKLCVLE